MTPAQAVRALEKGGTLPSLPAGVGEHFFARVAELSGSKPEAAIKLASQWQQVARSQEERAFAWRAKAAGERLQGLWAESATSFVTAGRHVSGLDAHRFQIGAIDSWARAGDLGKAVSLARRLAKALQSDPDSLGRVWLNVGNAYLWADDYPRARGALGRAVHLLDAAGRKGEGAAARLGLSTAELEDGGAEEAAHLAEAARSVFAEFGADFHASLCLVNVARAQLLQGKPDAAVRLLREARGSLKHSPPEAARCSEFLGDAYLGLQMFEDAESAYKAALRQTAVQAMPLNRANCLMGIGDARLRQGRKSSAKFYRDAAAGYQDVGNQVYLALAETGLAEAGTPDGGELASRAAKVLQSCHARHAQVRAELVAAALGEQPSRHLGRAARLIASGYGTPHEWRLHAIRASLNMGQKRRRSQRRMVEALLAGRLLLDSTTARASFLRDKSDALARFIDDLLESPTPDNVREALSVIARTRAATLADEVASSRSRDFPAAVLEELQRLRRALAQPESERGSSAATRRAEANVRRRLMESREAVLAAVAGPERPVQAATYATGATHAYRISGDHSERLDGSSDDWKGQLEWLEFELSSNMAQRRDPELVLDQIRSLGAATAFDSDQAVSPDGPLLGIPWQVLGHLAGNETTLVLNPTFSSASGSHRLPQQPRVAVWRGDHPKLPSISKEADLVESLFDNPTICRTPDEARDSLRGDFDLIHVAAHAELNRENPMFSAIELGGQPLFAYEVARASGRVGLAILSACETGAVATALKEEPDGWARAFLSRGAVAVVGACWPLDDTAALKTLIPLYDRLVSGERLSDSLTHGREACRAWNAHPFYWGPFAIFGGYQ